MTILHPSLYAGPLQLTAQFIPWKNSLFLHSWIWAGVWLALASSLRQKRCCVTPKQRPPVALRASAVSSGLCHGLESKPPLITQQSSQGWWQPGPFTPSPKTTASHLTKSHWRAWHSEAPSLIFPPSHHARKEIDTKVVCFHLKSLIWFPDKRPTDINWKYACEKVTGTNL